MRTLYRKLISFFEHIIIRLNLRKTFFAEYIGIYKKRHLYRHIKWTKEQQQAFDNFWAQHYGRRISNRWHRLYEAINGVHHIDYFPEFLFTTKLEPALNPYFLSKMLGDKAFVSLLYEGHSLDDSPIKLRTPKTFVLSCGRFLYDDNWQVIHPDTAMERLLNIGDCLIKPTQEGAGRGVRILHLQNGVDQRTGQTLQSIFQEYKQNFVVQEKIRPHHTCSSIYDKSISTIRVMTYILNHQVHHTPIVLKTGTAGAEIDTGRTGGISVGMNEKGELHPVSFGTYATSGSIERFTAHPDSHFPFSGHTIHGIPQILAYAKKIHGFAPYIGACMWDFAINEAGDILVLETNLKGAGIRTIQVGSAVPIFGDNTPAILQFIKNK